MIPDFMEFAQLYGLMIFQKLYVHIYNFQKTLLFYKLELHSMGRINKNKWERQSVAEISLVSNWESDKKSSQIQAFSGFPYPNCNMPLKLYWSRLQG